MDAIVFKKVIPLFGQSDIRGSSSARLESIQSDLSEQLNLAGTVMHRAVEARPWPLIGEFAYRIDQRIAKLKAGLTAEEERLIASFLKYEVEPNFDELGSIGPGVSHAIDRYNQTPDPTNGAVYCKRRDFETSVALLNNLEIIDLEDLPGVSGLKPCALASIWSRVPSHGIWSIKLGRCF